MRPYRTSHRRRGTVTVIVIAFLMLLLIMGLTFAFYGLREAEETRVYRDGERGGHTGVGTVHRTSSGIDDPPEPDTIHSAGLASALYGSSDDLTGAFNSLRTWEIARSMYGWNPKVPSPFYPFQPESPTSPYAAMLPANLATQAAIQPFCGIGHVPMSTVVGPSQLPAFTLPPTVNPVNFTWWPDMDTYVPGVNAQGRMFDPDNNYGRDPRQGAPVVWDYTQNPPVPAYRPAGSAPGATDRYWARNPDYTYPDLVNFYLGAIDPMTGRVLVQSFHRRELIADSASGAMVAPPRNPDEEPPPNGPRTGPVQVPPTYLPADTNPWTNAIGRLQMLRPRPVDHQWPPQSGLSEWRYPTMNPDGSYGDVELLVGKLGGRQLDAQWVDLDLPVRTWRGKAYKPLMAFLIVDLDGRVNLNTAGNFYPIQVPQPSGPPLTVLVHGSHQGIGPWEVNPSRVMITYPPAPPLPGVQQPPYANADEGAALSLGTPTAHARFGASWLLPDAGPPLQPLVAPIKQYWPYVFQLPPKYIDPTQPQRVGTNQPPSGSAAHFYGGVDYDGRGMPNWSKYSDDDPQGHRMNYTWGLPFVGQAPGMNPPFVPNPNSRFGNGIFQRDAANNVIYDERSHHPSLYNPYLLRSRAWIDLNPGTPVQPRFIPNRTFGVDEMRHLNAQFNFNSDLRALDAQLNSVLSQKSHLARLAPTTLGNPAFRTDTVNGWNQFNARFAVTTLSNDLDLPGSGPTNIAGYQLQPFNPATPFMQPTGSGTGVNPANPAVGVADHDDSYRTTMNTVLGPVDINRKLTEYRADLNRPLGANNVGNVQRAIGDRQQLARDIFERLRRAAGLSGAPVVAGDDTNRFLAQVAVNIVDFIDNDDCITPFKWTSQNGGGAGQAADDLTNEQTDTAGLTTYRQKVQNDWVFGFERPRVTLNETYLRVQNDPTDPMTNNMATLPYDLLMWLELHNPLAPATPAEQLIGMEGYYPPATDDNTHGGYRAALKDTFQGGAGEKSIYRALIARRQMQPGNPDPMGMRARNNVAGLPTDLNTLLQDTMTMQPKVLIFDRGGGNMTVVDDQGGTVIQPNLGSQYRDNSFYLVGPQADQQMGMGRAQIPNPNPVAQAHLTSTSLQAKVQFTEFVGGQMQWAPTFILQRLACPGLAPGPFNPYVTIDYFESEPVAINNRLKYDDMGQPGNPAMAGVEKDWSETFAWGRRQPYDSVIVYGDAQHYRQTTGMAMMGQINFTFGQHNGDAPMPPQPPPANWSAGQTLEQPFRPLAHYDRIVLNPSELFHVVGTKPHEFGQEYCGPTQPPGPTAGLRPNGRLKYTLDWLDHGAAPNTPQGTFLFRALGMLRTGTHMDALGMGGKVPGKVNINTIFSQQVFEAIVDAQSANRFNQNDMNNAWNAIVRARHANVIGPGAPLQFSLADRPFRGYATTVDSTTGRHRTPIKPDMLWQENAAPVGPFGADDHLENFTPGPAGRASAVEKYEMLSKSFNQFTTRSNCFAIYSAIGYFEVRNPGPYNELNRPILGKELGIDDGTTVRHRYFSIIDRTNLTIEQPRVVPVNPAVPLPPTLQGQAPVYFSYQPQVPQPQPDPMTGAVAPIADPVTVSTAAPPTPVTVRVKIPAIGRDAAGGVVGQYDGTLWTIRAGVSRFMIGVGDKQEEALVTAVSFDPVPPDPMAMPPDPGGNSAVVELLLSPQQPLTRPSIQHNRGATMRLTNPDPSQPPAIPGNPGPQPGFNYKSPRYASVVKYVEQLK